jgi:hypothetical protein
MMLPVTLLGQLIVAGVLLQDVIVDTYADVDGRVAYYRAQAACGESHPSPGSVLPLIILVGATALISDLVRYRDMRDLLSAFISALVLYFYVGVIQPSILGCTSTDQPELLLAAVDDIRAAHGIIWPLHVLTMVVLAWTHYTRNHARKEPATKPEKKAQ